MAAPRWGGTELNYLLDTLTLIELHDLNQLKIIAGHVSIAVLDIVLAEFCPSCCDLSGMANHLQLCLVPSETAWLEPARSYCDGCLSLQDALNLHYAKLVRKILITDEPPLQVKCQQEKVQTQTMLWLMERYSGCKV
ncbi:hypothetical protein ACQ4M3_00310 [Leptolyngbya sp. AN03gr2]|uniref:hypothetical protein n=1 Tax=unclassified Leptolyngbya TaxID=2650499 RepID=UPI003D30F35E